MNETNTSPWRDGAAAITDHWRLAQLQRDWRYYGRNPLIRREIERELDHLFEVLGEQGGFLPTQQPLHHAVRQAAR